MTDKNSQTTSPQMQSAVQLVESSPDFRLIRKVPAPTYIGRSGWTKSTGQVVCAIVDCEATSADPATAHPIELGMVKVAFHPEMTDGQPQAIEVIESLSMLNDPGVPSEPGALAAHGITAEELAGKTFDRTKIADFLKDVDFIIAHNASYDRPVLTRHIPSMNEMQWSCSMKEIKWGQLGVSSRALDYLLYRAGYFHTGHRALADCEALLAVLSHRFLAGEAPLFTLNQTRAQSNWIILCDNAPYAAKDAMRARGYRWNSGTEGIPSKAWSTPELDSKEALLTELDWLSQSVYKTDAPVTSIPVDATIRYASDQSALSFQKRRTFHLYAAIRKLNTELGREQAPEVAPVAVAASNGDEHANKPPATSWPTRRPAAACARP